MSQKENSQLPDNENREVIDEQEFLRTLVDRTSVDHPNDFNFNGQGMNSKSVVFTKQSGCLNLRSILINLLIYTLVLMVTSGWFNGFYISSFWGAFETAIWMSVLNVILKPILVILTLPLTIITFGLFYVVVNGIVLVIADYIMGPVFEINSFGVAVLASIFISLLRLFINHFVLKNSNFKVN
ncbi:MAG: phage holin family protein [Turicibacter sp.]